MDNLIAVTLEAHNPPRNHHRAYTLRIGQDMFGEWTVAVNFGRAGVGGREIHRSGDADVMKAFISDCLRRRMSAPRHIGCEYHVTNITAADSIEAYAWFPDYALLHRAASHP